MNSDPVKEQEEVMEHLTLFTADSPGLETPPAMLSSPLPTQESPAHPTAATRILNPVFSGHFAADVALSKNTLGFVINAYVNSQTTEPPDLFSDPCSVDGERVARVARLLEARGGESMVDLDLLMRCYAHLGEMEMMAQEKEKEVQEHGGGGTVGEVGEGEVSPLEHEGMESSLFAEDRSVEEAGEKKKDVIVVGGGRGGGGGGGLGKRKRRDDSSTRPRTRSKKSS